MQIWPEFMNAPKLAASAAASRSASASTTMRRLAAELEQAALQVLRALGGDDPPDARGAGEVHAPHRRVRDQLVDDLRRVLGRVQ